jgi:adenine-specific DNA-methyltransferase
MEKHFLDRQTRDGAQLTIEQIAAICPSAITEVQDENTGEIVRKVNFTTLRQLLGDLSVETPHEAYDFTWVGKTAARREAAMPISQTLRPCPEESVDWDTTKNLYIEGDNLQVLKLLQNYYAGQIKMIYIDPPYNTGHDFVYHDDFHQTIDEYEEAAGVRDELGNRFYVNNDSNGRFHSDWCSMIYARLMVTRSLLADDGVICISLDDNEIHNLQKVCDEVFGEKNKVGLFTIMSNPRGSQNSKLVSSVHEYILMYGRNINYLQLKGLGKDEDSLAEFKETDKDGRKYRLLGLRKRGGAWRKEDRPNMFYPIYINPQTGECSLEKNAQFSIEVIPQRPTGELSRWTWGREKFIVEHKVLVGKKVNRAGEGDSWDVFRKDYIDSESGEEKTTKIKTIWDEKETNYQNAKNEIKALFGNSEIFDYPKPTYIVKKLASILYNEEGDIYMDFFSGSATTAQAIMQLCMEDGEKRKFIMVQLPEAIQDEKSEAYKAGYRNICEIGKERIRRAGKMIREQFEAQQKDLFSGEKTTLDTGFRVLKLDDSNFKQVSFAAKDYSQAELAGLIDNIKEDRSDLDLLFDCMLRWGVELSLPIVRSEADHCQILNVNDGDLVACLAPNETITEAVIDAIAAMHPLRIVLRDTAFEEASQKMNIYELFKQRLGWSDDQASKQIRVI